MRCTATTQIEDECSICNFQCEKEEGHEGSHLTHYPGQWGDVRIPTTFENDSPQVSAEFHRNQPKSIHPVAGSDRVERGELGED